MSISMSVLSVIFTELFFNFSLILAINSICIPFSEGCILIGINHERIKFILVLQSVSVCCLTAPVVLVFSLGVSRGGLIEESLRTNPLHHQALDQGDTTGTTRLAPLVQHICQQLQALLPQNMASPHDIRYSYLIGK